MYVLWRLISTSQAASVHWIPSPKSVPVNYCMLFTDQKENMAHVTLARTEPRGVPEAATHPTAPSVRCEASDLCMGRHAKMDCGGMGHSGHVAASSVLPLGQRRWQACLCRRHPGQAKDGRTVAARSGVSTRASASSCQAALLADWRSVQHLRGVWALAWHWRGLRLANRPGECPDVGEDCPG